MVAFVSLNSECFFLRTTYIVYFMFHYYMYVLFKFYTKKQNETTFFDIIP